PSLQRLFLHAFTVGLQEPARRVTEGEWQGLFLQLEDGGIRGPACRGGNLWEPGMAALTCWNEECVKSVTIPPRLVLFLPGGALHLLLRRDARVLRRHIDPIGPEDQASSVIGQIRQNPNNPHVWGLCTLTATPWTATAADGRAVEVPPQKSVPLA